MKKHIYDESNGLSYILHGDYYLPDLAVNEGEPTYARQTHEWLATANFIFSTF